MPLNSSSISFDELQQLCASLQNTTSNSSTPSATKPNRPANYQVWLYGLSFVTAISLCAVVGIIITRYLKRHNIYSHFITFFVGIGVGSLSGSAVFHLLPQAFGLINEFDPNPSHDFLGKSFAAVIGIYLFFFSDKAIKMILETRKRSAKCQKHALDLNETSIILHRSPDTEATAEKVGSNYDQKNALVSPATKHEKNGRENFIDRQAHSICVHDHDVDYKEGDSVIATVAWMIIFGDGLHNLIDGISIGASFSESILSGISVSVAVLCEEFPHELGDVAILISAGMSVKQALIYNLLSALTCYVGFAIGIFAGNIDDVFASYTFGFAGGMFLYISLACMMPEMKTAMEKALDGSLKAGVTVLSLQISGICCGLSIMWTLARFGGSIQF